MPRTHSWTVIGYYEDNNEAYSNMVVAENSLMAAAKAANGILHDNLIIVGVIKGHHLLETVSEGGLTVFAEDLKDLLTSSPPLVLTPREERIRDAWLLAGSSVGVLVVLTLLYLLNSHSEGLMRFRESVLDMLGTLCGLAIYAFMQFTLLLVLITFLAVVWGSVQALMLRKKDVVSAKTNDEGKGEAGEAPAGRDLD
jgi:uncharacterized membrane protein